MAEQLDKFPRPIKGRWDEYLDGNIWKLSLVEAESKSFASLRSSLAHAAVRKGLKLRTQQMDDEYLVVQAYE